MALGETGSIQDFYYGQNLYKIIQTDTTIADARKNCLNQKGGKGSMLKIQSAEEFGMISIELRVRNLDKDHTYWIDDINFDVSGPNGTTRHISKPKCRFILLLAFIACFVFT